MAEYPDDVLAAAETVDRLCAELDEELFLVTAIGNPKNAKEFLAKAEKRFPLLPDLDGAVGWSAFSEALYIGLNSYPIDQIALVVRDATEFRPVLPLRTLTRRYWRCGSPPSRSNSAGTWKASTTPRCG